MAECFFPTADAGPDQIVPSGMDPVILDGSGSSHPDEGRGLSYAWTPPTGIVVSQLTTISPTFTAPVLSPTDDDLTLTFSLVVTDDEGIMSTSDSVTITVTAPANQAPVAAAGPNQSVASGTDPVTLDGTASTDPDADQTLSYSWMQTGGPSVTLSGDTTANPTFTAAMLSSGEQDVTYVFELVVTDNLGLASAADTVEVLVIAPPLLSLETPAEGAVLVDEAVLVSGTTDPDLDIEVKITNTVGQGVFTRNVTSDADGNWEVESRALLSGQYQVTATAVDDVSNISSKTNSFTIDSILPSLVVERPEDDFFTDGDGLEISGYTDEDATLMITIYDENGDIIATPTVQQNPNGTFDALVEEELEEGSYTVSVVSTGNNGVSATVIRDIIVDQTMPVTTITQPGSDAIIGTNTPVFSGTTEAHAEVDIFLNGEFLGTVAADENGDWSFDVEDTLEDETYTVDVVATDRAGNVGEGDQVIFDVDVAAPDVAITSPSQGSTIYGTPEVIGRADPGSEVELTLNGELVGTAIADENGQWTLVFEEALEDGTYTVEATATSAAGNRGSSGSISFEIDTAAEIVITSPSDGDIVDGGELIVEGSGEANAEVTLSVGDQSATTTVDDDGNWSIILENLPVGTTTLEATSDAGDSADSITITVELFDVSDGSAAGGCGGCNSSGAPGSGLSWFIVLLVGLSVVALRRRSYLEPRKS